MAGLSVFQNLRAHLTTWSVGSGGSQGPMMGSVGAAAGVMAAAMDDALGADEVDMMLQAIVGYKVHVWRWLRSF